MRRYLAILLVLTACVPLDAHVGSPDVFYEGDAGPYHLFVTVRMPQVIPGVAEIEVRSASKDVQSIQVVPMRLTGPGSNLPPIPDLAQRSKDDPQFFVSSLWLMEFGSLQVRIQADGAKGKGEISVPVPAFARQSLPMNGFLRGLLGFFLIFLTLGLVLISGAIVRESSVAPGEPPQPAKLRRAKIVMAVAVVAAGLLLYGGRSWWGAEARSFQRSISFFEPPLAETALQDGNTLVIRAVGRDRQWSTEVKMEQVVPDHGHLMHLFLIGLPQMDRMWHLHPERGQGGSFVQKLPAMPAGQYQVFADVVDKNGFPWTLVGKVDLPQVAGAAPSGDDAEWQGGTFTQPPSNNTVATLADGGRLLWDRDPGPLKANMPASFKFRLVDKTEFPGGLEPYMGMAAHAAVVGSDLSVFAHIHPAGSVSMAALELAQAGLPDPARMTMAMPMRQVASLPPEFSFPYGFPHPGSYRVFVQIKRGGKVQTGTFDVQVQ